MVVAMSTRIPAWFFYTLLAILAAGAMALLFISTPAGAGLANDSAAYIAGARSILQGTGYSDIWLDSTLEPITHYPPLLSLLLSALGLLGVDPLRGARILNIFFFGANTALLGLLGWRISHSRPAGLWAAALFMLGASFLRVHVFAMSEPLFLFLSLLAFLCLDRYVSSRQRKFWLVIAGLASGLAFLTRYSALALLPVFIIALLLLPNTLGNTSKKTWRGRLIPLGLFLAGALPPMVAWFLRNKLAGGSATNRIFQFHPVAAETFKLGFYNTSQFLMPFAPWQQVLFKTGVVEWILAVLSLGLLLWLVIKSWKLVFHPPEKQDRFLAYATALYLFGYLGAVLFSMSFFDASTKFLPRILAPLYVSGLLLLVTFAAWAWQLPARFGLLARFIVPVLAVVTLAFSVYGTTLAVADFKTAGQGYASWKWHDSLVMATLKTLPPGIAIYTNAPPGVYLVTGRPSRVLPTPIDPVDNLARKDYEQSLAQMRTDLLAGKAVLALFDTSTQEDAPGMQDVIGITAGLKVIQKTQGDTLYGKP